MKVVSSTPADVNIFLPTVQTDCVVQTGSEPRVSGGCFLTTNLCEIQR